MTGETETGTIVGEETTGGTINGHGMTEMTIAVVETRVAAADVTGTIGVTGMTIEMTGTVAANGMSTKAGVAGMTEVVVGMTVEAGMTEGVGMNEGVVGMTAVGGMSAVEAAGMTTNGGTSMREGGAAVVVEVAVMITAGVGGITETIGGNMGLRELGLVRICFSDKKIWFSDTYPLPTPAISLLPASEPHAL